MLIYAIPYIFLLFVSLFDTFDDSFNNEYLKNILLLILVSILAVIAGIRFDIGMDFGAYHNFFERIDSLGSSAPYNYLEPGFRVVIIFIRSINLPPYSLFFFYGTLVYTFIFVGVRKISPLPFLSIFIFFTVFMIGYVFNVMRQGIAMSILIYVIPDIKDKKIVKVFFMALIAASFHQSGLFIILAFFLYQIKIQFRLIKWLTLFAVLYYSVSVQLSNVLIRLMPIGIQDKIYSYMERFPGEVSLSSYGLRLIILGILLVYYHKLKSIPEFEGVFNIYFFGFLIYTLFSFQDMAAARLNMFFRILEILLIPYAVSVNKDKINRVMLFSFVLAIVTSIFLKDLQHPINFPFQFFW